MILKIPYEKLEGHTSVAIDNGGDFENVCMIVMASTDNVAEAMEYARKNKWVVGVECNTTFEVINSVGTAGVNAYICHTMQGAEVTPEEEAKVLQFAEQCKVVTGLVITDAEFHDMRFVKKICEKGNIRFSGGNFLRIKHEYFGAVPNDLLAKPLPELKIPLIAEGEGSADTIISYLDTDYSLGYDACPFKAKGLGTASAASKSSKSRTPKAKAEGAGEKVAKPAKKKTVSSIVGSGMAKF